MPAAPPLPTSPYAGLDYEPGLNPPSEGIGDLALTLVKLFGVDGMTALTAAILLKKGEATAAMDSLAAEIHRLADARDAAKAKRVPQ